MDVSQLPCLVGKGWHMLMQWLPGSPPRDPGCSYARCLLFLACYLLQGKPKLSSISGCDIRATQLPIYQLLTSLSAQSELCDPGLFPLFKYNIRQFKKNLHVCQKAALTNHLTFNLRCKSESLTPKSRPGITWLLPSCVNS